MFMYSKLCSALCQGILVHPTTGEKYGGTDFLNPIKLAELNAVSVIEVDTGSGDILNSISVVLNEDGESATLTRNWREKTEFEIAADIKSDLEITDKTSARKAEDLWTLLISKGIINSEDAPEAVSSWISERIALREQL